MTHLPGLSTSLALEKEGSLCVGMGKVMATILNQWISAK